MPQILAPPLRAFQDMLLAMLVAIVGLAVASSFGTTPRTVDAIMVVSVAGLTLVAATRWPAATRWLVAAALLLTFFILHATASADATPTVQGTPVVTVDVAILSAFVGTWIPLLTALLTKARALSHVKAYVNLGLSVLATIATVLIAHGGSMSVQDLAIGFMLTFGASGSSYQHFWKPVGTAYRVNNAAPLSGFG